MKELKDRAHEIALAVLPKVIEENKVQCIGESMNHTTVYNTAEITNLYLDLYEGILQDLQHYNTNTF